MNVESEIDQRMLRFYKKTKESFSSVLPPKPFLVTIVESKTDSVPFSGPIDVPTKDEETPPTLAPPPPTITDLQPNIGPTKGGQAITVSGTNFIADSKVFVGDVVATSIVFVNDKKLTAVTPAHARGRVSIKVENVPANPTFSYEITLAYLYVAPPAITLVTPAFGSTAGGTAVSISGIDLAFVVSVNWAGSNIPFSYDSVANVIRVTTPPHSAGFIQITLTNRFGDAGGASNAFKYVSPPDHYEWSTVIGHTPTDTGFDNGASKRFAIVAKNGATTNTDYQGYVNISTILIGVAVSFNDSPNIDYPISVVNGTALFDVQAFCIDHGASTVQSLQFHAQDTQYSVGGDSPIYGVSNLPDLSVGGRRHGGGGGGGVSQIGWVMGYATAYGAHGVVEFGPWNWEGVTLNNRTVKIQMKDASGFVIDFNGSGTLDHVYITPQTSFNGFGVSHPPTANFVHGEANVTVSASYTGSGPNQSYAYFYLRASANSVNGQSPQCSILNHL
jgi:hypothetical protein